MTKEEYEKLLNSDYWKGYSYSLIKERNFTCEDCGRKFYNERNKLQVHHLIYRDIAPWSYKPEELVVLCEDCHKKRHGINTSSEKTDYSQFVFDKDTTTITSSDVFKDNYFTDRKKYRITGILKSALIVGFVIFALYFGISNLFVSQIDSQINESEHENRQLPNVEREKTINKATNRTIIDIPQKIVNAPIITDHTTSDVEIEEKQPSNEEEGLSTVEIMQRMHHADVVKEAKRAGVSTEGSTVEIMQRIHHADVVKEAKRAGVSTEGSTVEIMQRIHRKEMEKYGY